MKSAKYFGRAIRRKGIFQEAAELVVEALERRTMLSPLLLAYDPAPGATDNTPGNLAADLVGAINTANTAGGTNTIKLDPGQTYDFTSANNYWYGPDALPAIKSTITIAGYGATLQRDASSAQTTAGGFRFFFVSGGLTGLVAGNLELENLTLKNGFAKGGDSGGGGGGLGAGGAIFNQGTLILNGVTLTGNTAQGGASSVMGLNTIGGGGMGQNGQSGNVGGGMGGATPGASGGNGFGGSYTAGIGGGGGGFSASATGQFGAGSSGLGSGTGDGGDGGTGSAYDGSEGTGGNFGIGGTFGTDDGGGGGVGAGGGGGADNQGGGGGFGGGGGQDANGGFGGGAGNFKNGISGIVPGFGGGGQSSTTGSAGGGAGLGGAVFSMYGSLTVVNSTITGNSAVGGASTYYVTGFGGQGAGGGSGFGGGIFNLDGPVELTDTTIVGNTVAGGMGDKVNGAADGGSLYNLAYGKSPTGAAVNASGSIVGSILANSTGSTNELVNNTFTGHASANASIVLDGGNIIRTQSNSGAGAIAGTAALTSDPELAALGDNGGPTPTMALLVGSPALGTGAAVIGTSTDQRGVTRTSAPDIGAFEATTDYPTPLQAENPLGSLIYDPSVNGSITSAGAVDDYTLDLAANQTLTLVMTPSAGLTGSLEVQDPSTNVLAVATGSSAGATVIVETVSITTAGTYTIGVSGASNSTGTFILQAILNAAYVPATTGTSLATAYDLGGAFASLGTTPAADRAGAVGVLGSSSAYFGFQLSAGESASIAIKGSGGAAGITLDNSTGNLLALPDTGSGVDGIISNFVAPSTATYYVSVSGASSLNYDLVVTRGADFDIHESSFLSAQPLNGGPVVLGSLPAGGQEWYTFNVNAGDNLNISTTTPGGTTASGQQFVNDFSSEAFLYDSSGNLVAEAEGNTPDGRNDLIDFTAPTSGAYRLEITGSTSDTTGEYTASIQGATGGSNAFTVTGTNPAAGADLGVQVSSMTVTFSDGVLFSSLSDSDFTIDGNNATGFSVIDSTDVSFSFATTSDAVHSVMISGVSDIHGVSVTPDSLSFQTDDVAPTVISSSIAEGAMLPTGNLTEVLTFSKPLDPSSVVATDITLDGTARGLSYTASSYSFDPTGTILTVNYSSLPTDAYTFTLVAGAGNFTSVTGVPLASNFVVDFTIPPVPSTLSISTTQQPASAVLGNSISDMVSLGGGKNPTGTVTFDLYNNATASGTPLFSDTESLPGGAIGPATTGATESGNTVTITTTSPTGLSTGDQVTITGVGVGGYNGTFTVTNGSNPMSFTYTDTTTGLANSGGGTFSLPSVGAVATSKSFTPTSTGTDYWVVSYNGDANNGALAGSDSAEPVTITPATPVFSKLSNSTITLHAASETFTGKIAAGSLIPSGNVIVTLNGVQKSVAIKPNGTFSATFNTSKLGIGTYTVQYSYAGNSNFNPVSSTSTLGVSYGIKPLFKNVKYHAGTTIWIQMLLTDASGKSVNTTHTTVTTIGLALATSPSKLLPGKAVGRMFTPDSDGDFFGLYLSTTGFANGQYILYFTVSGDPVTHSVTITVG